MSLVGLLVLLVVLVIVGALLWAAIDLIPAPPLPAIVKPLLKILLLVIGAVIIVTRFLPGSGGVLIR